MARQRGEDVRAYFGAKDVSGDLVGIEIAPTRETHQRNVLNSGDWKVFDPGLRSWEGSFSAFYQPGASELEGLMATALESDTTNVAAVTVVDGGADAIGDVAIWVASHSILTKRGQPINVADLTKLSGTLKGDGRLGMDGRLLHVLEAETATENGTSVDNGAATSNGGRANLHVTAVDGGTWTVKVQHSSDNSVWADLITFTNVTAATAESLTVSGTINRYVRYQLTKSGGTSITPLVALARF